MKIRTRIFLCFTITALIPLLVITFLAYSRFTSTTYERVEEIADTTVTNAAESVDNTMEDIERSLGLFTFYSNSEFSIVDELRPYADRNYAPDSYTILKSSSSMQFVAENLFYTYSYLNGIYIFTPSGATFNYTSGRNGDLVYGYDPTGDPWYQETLDLSGKLYISPIDTPSWLSGASSRVLFARAVYDVYSHNFLGVLVFDCDPSLFDLSVMNPMPDITFFRLRTALDGAVLYEDEQPNRHADLHTMEKETAEGKLLLEATFDYNALRNEFNFTGFLLMGVSLFCILAVLAVSHQLSRSLTYPIEHLSRKMAAQHGSHLSLSGKYLQRTDEIGVLYNEYNNMIEELNASIKRDYQDKLITLDAQMRSLEAQINSHFLFNTLESINSLAELDEDERISTMVMALGNMFRYSIKTKSELVTIDDELRHVRDYVAVQEIRFDYRFHLLLDMPEEMHALRVLKLILQPLVENALTHGLNYCTAGDTITIRGRLDPRDLWLTVTDNGVGMSPEEVDALRSRLQEESGFTELGHRTRQSIGLKNIHSRIELYYGKGYGLEIESRQGGDSGTSIRIHLPRIE